MDDQQLELLVQEVIKTFMPRGSLVKPTDRLLKDLKLIGDDAEHAIEILERRLKIRIPDSEWGAIETVRDVVNLLKKYMATPNA
jgi:acyl carrier protein